MAIMSSELLSCISIIISISVAVGSTIAFFVYDRRLKKQQKQINAYELDKIRIDKKLRNSAKLSLFATNADGAVRNEVAKLTLINNGLSKAYNIEVMLNNDRQYFLKFRDLFITNVDSMEAGNYIDDRFTIEPVAAPCVISYTLKWNDEDSKEVKKSSDGVISLNID